MSNFFKSLCREMDIRPDGFDPVDKQILDILADMAREDGKVTRSQIKIARVTWRHKRTVQNSIDRWAAIGAIEKYRPRGKRHNVYYLNPVVLFRYHTDESSFVTSDKLMDAYLKKVSDPEGRWVAIYRKDSGGVSPTDRRRVTASKAVSHRPKLYEANNEADFFDKIDRTIAWIEEQPNPEQIKDEALATMPSITRSLYDSSSEAVRSSLLIDQIYETNNEQIDSVPS